MAVFVGNVADKAHRVEVGRCHECFALQATALGLRNAFVNQPVGARAGHRLVMVAASLCCQHAARWWTQ